MSKPRELARQPREGVRNWLKPTFLVTRGVYRSYKGEDKPLPPIYIAVLSVDPEADTATYEVLGCPASPSTVSRKTLADLLRTRGTKL